MIEALSDLDALALQCRQEQSKEYVAEAIRCYKAGAYRATIVSTWIAVVFDLIDKIRELAVSGDQSAKQLESQYEAYIAQIAQNNSAGLKGALEFEREILESCRDKLQFFDPQQFIDLERLREDRHRCAHPSFQRSGVPYYPSPEQARLHLRNAISHVLAQPPVQGKAALATLKTLVASAYFPTDDKSALVQLESSELKTATEAMIRGFVDLLVFNFLTDGDPLFLKRQALAALNATHVLYPAMVEERLKKQLNKGIRDVPDAHFPGAAAMVAVVKVAPPALDAASVSKIAKFVEEGPTSQVLPLLEPLSAISTILPSVKTRVEGLTIDELSQAVSTHRMSLLAKERALHFLSQVRSWDKANEVFSKVVLPVFECLTQQDVERVIRMPVESGADLPGATAYRLFIEKVRKAKLLEESDLNALLAANGSGYLLPQPRAA